MRRFGVVCALTALVLFLVADTASACRGRRRARRCGPCYSYSYSYNDSYGACRPCGPVNAGAAVVEQGAEGDIVTDDRPPEPDPENDLPPPETIDDEGSPSDPTDAPEVDEAAPETTDDAPDTTDEPSDEPSPTDEPTDASDGPTDESAPTVEPTDESAPVDEPSDDTAPTDEPATDEPAAEEPADVDDQAAIGQSRTWWDNTGRHSTHGSIERIDLAAAVVELRKQNGRLARVPFARLSQADRDFVRAQAVAMGPLVAAAPR